MSNDPTSPDMVNRADYWAMKMADGSDAVTEAELAEFHAWLFASPANEDDFRRAVALMQLATDLSPAQQSALISPSGSTHSESDHAAGRRNILKFTALAASAAVMLVTGGLFLEHRGFFGETHATKTGEQYTVKFPDGSIAHLNTRTEIRWRGRGEERRVELLSGEALFDVVHDEKRPFVVHLDGSEIRVLGTRFNVYRKDVGDVRVTVLEGVVEVRGFGRGEATPEWVRRVRASEEMEYRRIGLVGEPHKTDALAAVQWREGKFVPPPDGVPLSVVLDELQRYSDKRIVMLDARLATRPVSGVILTRDVKGTLNNLRKNLRMEVRESESAYMLDATIPDTERN
jgi:transmembrane sensor